MENSNPKVHKSYVSRSQIFAFVSPPCADVDAKFEWTLNSCLGSQKPTPSLIARLPKVTGFGRNRPPAILPSIAPRWCPLVRSLAVDVTRGDTAAHNRRWFFFDPRKFSCRPDFQKMSRPGRAPGIARPRDFRCHTK